MTNDEAREKLCEYIEERGCYSSLFEPVISELDLIIQKTPEKESGSLNFQSF